MVREERHDVRLERWGLAAMGIGVLLWLVAPAFMDLGYDANAYAATGHGWARHGELILEWGDVLTWWPTEPGHSHHFPPAYPFYLGLVFSVAGYGLAQAKAAAVLMSVLALAVVYATTRDLYGRTAAAATAGLVALAPHFLWVTGMGFSEMLALLLFTLTMWAILRSLDDERFIVPAGVFAGAAYLARASMGAFFVIAGGGGLAWRLLHRGWKRTLTSVWYGLAILLFGLIVGAWAYRNVSLYGWPNWETSIGSRGIDDWIAAHPRAFALSALIRAPLLLSILVPFLLVFREEARRSLRRIRDEHVSALWLSVGLVWILGLIFSAAYLSMSLSRHEILRLDNLRYALVGLVPLLWALVRAADLRSPSFHRRWRLLAALLLAGCLLVFTFPAQSLWGQAARSLDPHLQEGDTIAVAGSGKYPFYAYLTRPQDVDVHVHGHGDPADPAEWILAGYDADFEGYVRLAEKTVGHPWWPAAPDYVAVHGREDVVAARAPELAPLRAGW